MIARSGLLWRHAIGCLMPVALLLGMTAAPGLAAGDAASQRPNVLFVFSDMQRAYSMGCYGDTNARTPRLDGLAKEGVRFDAAISNTPVCCSYRACLMSGQYAHHNGVMSNGVGFRPVRTARYKYVLFAQGENREQFFDMQADPGETKNLIAEASLASEIERHRSLLKQWMDDTHDTFGKASAAARSRKRKSPAGVTSKNKSPQQRKAATN